MRWIILWPLALVGCPVAESPKSGDSADSGSGGGGDTAGDSAGSDCERDADGDGWCGESADCDDDDPDVHPEAVEQCNGIDDDCNGLIDDNAGATYYADADGDGYGDADAPVQSCSGGEGLVDNGADCDDTDAAVHPGATEVGNGIDDDCDGDIDEDDTDEDAPAPTEAPEIDVSWSSRGVAIRVSGAASGWEFGMAETGVGDVGWFGESCIPGDEPWGYPDYGWDVCHTLSRTGGEVIYVGDINDVADGYTIFTETIAAAGNITYSLWSADTGECWVFGDEPSYYSDYGCTEI